MVRAKFRVESITSSKWGPQQEVRTIKLVPVVGGSEENKQFYAATPGGSIDLQCLNLKAAEQFDLGKEYYIDFTPAEEAAESQAAA